MRGISKEDREEEKGLRGETSLINAVLHWQVAVALSKRTTNTPQDSKSVKNGGCLLQLFVINNITNAQRLMCASHGMNSKSEKLNPATSMLIIGLAAF